MCPVNAPGYMISRYPVNISRDLQRKVNRMTNGVIKEIPVSCFKMPMMIPKGENQGPEHRRNLIQVKYMHVKYMQVATPCPEYRAV